MIVYPFPTIDALCEMAADLIVEAALDAIDHHGTFNLALSGGRTPRTLYQRLVTFPRFTADIVASTQLFVGDERPVPTGHEESNSGMIRRLLVAPRRFPRDHVHFPNGGAENLELEALRYEIEIKRQCGLAPTGFPCFDLTILGVGHDGHTASLFPESKALDEKYRTYIINSVTSLRTRRLTLTFPALNSSRHILVLCCGLEKASILAHVFAIGRRDPIYPIERIVGNGQNVIWLVDHEATSKFTDEQREFYQIGSTVAEEA